MNRTHCTAIVILVTGALIVAGCTRIRPSVTPIPSQYYQSGIHQSTTLLVLLPGMHDAVSKFENHGFIETVQQSGQPCDLVAVDAHYGYYDAGIITERLHNDVIIPAKKAGYTDIRIVGVSLGGFGALQYANRYPMEVDTLVLLAPWLGNKELIDSITAAGGLGDWEPKEMSAKNALQDIWVQRKNNQSATAVFPALYLGYGNTDKFQSAHRLLAGTLPEDHIFTVAGRHNWTSWEQLWKQMQAEKILCGSSEQKMKNVSSAYTSQTSNSSPALR